MNCKTIPFPSKIRSEAAEVKDEAKSLETIQGQEEYTAKLRKLSAQLRDIAAEYQEPVKEALVDFIYIVTGDEIVSALVDGSEEDA